jgi:predicted RNA-binding protein with PUA-like domain
MAYWLVKSEPSVYSWDSFVKEGETFWSGVRNYEARNNLRAMKKGEKVLYYHSNEGKEIVGLAQVSKESYQDPTTDDANWVVVNLKPVKALKKTVTLATLKADPRMGQLALVRKGRISVTPVTDQEFKDIMELAGEKVK